MHAVHDGKHCLGGEVGALDGYCVGGEVGELVGYCVGGEVGGLVTYCVGGDVGAGGLVGDLEGELDDEVGVIAILAK